MAQVAKIKFTKADKLKEKPETENLQFGTTFTDYMFFMEYDAEKGGWQTPEIRPFESVSLSPAASVES